MCIEAFDDAGQWPANDSRELYAWNRFNAARDGVDATWIDPCSGSARPVREVVADDLARLAARSLDPGFGKAAAMVKRLMEDGGQAGWMTDQVAAGAGMNDLSRVASEMFERPYEAGEGR